MIKKKKKTVVNSSFFIGKSIAGFTSVISVIGANAIPSMEDSGTKDVNDLLLANYTCQATWCQQRMVSFYYTRARNITKTEGHNLGYFFDIIPCCYGTHPTSEPFHNLWLYIQTYFPSGLSP